MEGQTEFIKKRKSYKGYAIFFFIVILALLWYVAYDKYRGAFDDGYIEGIKEGVDVTVVQLVEQSADCKIITLATEEKQVQFVDVNCIPR